MHTLIQRVQLLILILSLTVLPSTTAAALLVLNPRVSGDSLAVSSTDYAISPDGRWVVYRAFPVNSLRRQLYSAPTDGSAAPIVLHDGLAVTETVENFAIAPDNSAVVYRVGDATTDRFQLYRVPLAGGTSTLLNAPLQANGSVARFAISTNSSRVVYTADSAIDESYELFSVPLAGGAVIKLNSPLVAGGSVEADFEISANSSRVVYRADQDTNDVIELYSAQIQATGSNRLNGDLVLGGDVQEFQITPNGNRVLYLADQDVNGQRELYQVQFITIAQSGADAPLALNGSAKVNGPLVFNGSVTHFQISADSSRVVYRADEEQIVKYELYSVSLVIGTRVKLNDALVAGGNVASAFAISPNSSWVVYRADQQTNDVDELYAVPLAGGAVFKLNSAMAGDVDSFAISPDSTRVVYLADQEIVGTSELYAKSLPVLGGPITIIIPPASKLNAPLIANGDVFKFAISPDASRVVYTADQDISNVNELYSVPLADGTVTELNGLLVPNGNVTTFAISPDGSRVVYRADQQTNDIFALFAAFEQAPSATLEGPTESLGVGTVAVTVRLSQATTLANATVLLSATGGDAVANTDYSLPSTLISFAPGEKSKTVLLNVLLNPLRTEPRTVDLAVEATNTTSVGNPGTLTLTLAKLEGAALLPFHVALPLVTR